MPDPCKPCRLHSAIRDPGGGMSAVLGWCLHCGAKHSAACPNLPFQMGLWASLFVLSTLLINAPTVPAVLACTGLTKASRLGSMWACRCRRRRHWGRRARPVQQQQCSQHGRLWGSERGLQPVCRVQVSPVKLSIRQKAKRALLRYTATAIQARSAPCQQPQPATACCFQLSTCADA